MANAETLLFFNGVQIGDCVDLAYVQPMRATAAEPAQGVFMKRAEIIDIGGNVSRREVFRVHFGKTNTASNMWTNRKRIIALEPLLYGLSGTLSTTCDIADGQFTIQNASFESLEVDAPRSYADACVLYATATFLVKVDMQ